MILEPTDLGRSGHGPWGLIEFVCYFVLGLRVSERKPPVVGIEYVSGALILEPGLGTVGCSGLLMLLPPDPGKAGARGAKPKALDVVLRILCESVGTAQRSWFLPSQLPPLISLVSPSLLPSISPFTEEDRRKGETEGGKWDGEDMFLGISSVPGICRWIIFTHQMRKLHASVLSKRALSY